MGLYFNYDPKKTFWVFLKKKIFFTNSSLGGFGYGGQQALRGLFSRKIPPFLVET